VRGIGLSENSGRNQKPQLFKPGQSGNPAGKPRGTRHAALLALDAIGQEGAEGTLRAVVEAAGRGDMRAADILLRRVWPERKGRTVALDLPPMECAADLVKALGIVAQAMAAGQLTPDEAGAVANVLEVQRRAIETAGLEQRIAALEAAKAPQ